MAARDDLPCDFSLLWIAGSTLATDESRMTVSSYRSALNPLAQWHALKRLLHRAPDVAIFSLWRSVPIALALHLLRPRTRIVMFVHFDRSTHLLDDWLTRLGVAIADEVWGDSASALAGRVGHRVKRQRKISFVTSTLTPAVSSVPSPVPRFVLWARLNQQKGIGRAIALIDALVARGIDARFDVWGPDDGELAKLQKDVGKRGLGERVRFRGIAERAMLPVIANEASFFLQPSIAEGMSMSCVEAMQFGLVPLVTAVGEMAHYVEPGRTGLILDPDDVAGDAEQVAKLLNDPAHYAAIREQAIARWRDAPLYADDVCKAAHLLLNTPGA